LKSGDNLKLSSAIFTWMRLFEYSLFGADLRARGSGQGTTSGYGGGFSSHNRPNAHGGAHNLHSCGATAGSFLQPRTNQHQKYSGHINAAPLQVKDLSMLHV